MRNDHESKEQRQKLEVYHDAGTWLSVLNHFPSSDPASLDQVSNWKPDPPAFKTLSYRGGTLRYRG